MVIICPACTARFRIDTSGIKLERFKIKCPKCSDAIVVENPPEVSLPVTLEPEPGESEAGFGAAPDSPPGQGYADEPSPRSSFYDESPTDLVGSDADLGTGSPTDDLDLGDPGTEDLGSPTSSVVAEDTLRIARRGEGSAREGAAERAREARESIEAVREELAGNFDALMKQNYFELLGATKDAPAEEIKSAYFRLAKKYHPDRYVTQFSDEEMRRLRELSSRLNLAFNELRDPDRHKQYVLKITQPERYEKQQSANRVMEGMMQYEKGKVLFNKQNFGEALKCFEWAVELHSTEAEYHFMVGQTCLRASEGRKPDYERILAALEKAAELQPQTVKYHLALGNYWKIRGETKRAMRYYRNAKEIDPKSHEANREIRLYVDRKRKAEEEASASGKLKKLFGGSNTKKTGKV